MKFPNYIRSCGLATFLVAGLLSSCGPDTAEEQRQKTDEKMNDAAKEMKDNAQDVNKQMEQDRQALAKDLRDIRDDITTKLDKENEKLAGKDLKADERAECERMRGELEREKEQVETTLSSVEGADANTWATVQTSARTTMNDVNAWMKAEMEKMDKKTKADTDKDGH